MPVCSFEYAVIRVVPRVEREEFLNAGVVLSCVTQEFLQARIALNHERLKAFAPQVDTTLIEEYLNLIPVICSGGAEAGPIGRLPHRARFHWLVAPRSTIIQCSPVHSGISEHPAEVLECLLKKLVLTDV